MAVDSKNNNLRFKVLLNMLPIMGLILLYSTPILQASFSVIVPLFLAVLWMIDTVLITGGINFIFNNKAKWWVIYYLLGFLMVIFGLASVNFGFLLASLPKYVIPIMGFFVIRYYNRKELLFLALFFVLSFGGNLVWNIYMDILQPELFESLSSSEESRELATMLNLSNTSHNALSLFSICAFWTCLVNSQGLFKKLLFIVLIIVLAYFMLLVNTRGTTTLLLGILIIGLLLAQNEPDFGILKRKRYYQFWIITLFFILICFVVPILMYILEHIESERLATRLNDVLILTTSGNLNNLPEGSMALRIALSLTSLETFFASPINFLIGIGEQSYQIGDDLNKLGIGQHSEFIDVLARNGLAGAFLYYQILKNYRYSLCSLSKNRHIIKYVDVFFCIYIIYGFLNNVFQPFMLIFTFIIYPAIIILLNNSCNGKEKYY